MKNRSYVLNTALAVVMTVALTICIFLRTFCPWVIIPVLNIPNMALLSLIALLADHYLAKNANATAPGPAWVPTTPQTMDLGVSLGQRSPLSLQYFSSSASSVPV